MSDGTVVDVLLRGVAVIPGGTAAQVVEALQTKFIGRARHLLTRCACANDIC